MSRLPKIFYHCYDTERRRGGQKSVYQHVDALNQNGYQAFVLHKQSGYRLRWFENKTRVLCWSEFRCTFDPEHDYLVLPEDMGARILFFPGRKVVFNKSLFNGFWALGDKPDNTDPYQSSGVVAVLTVSDHNYRGLRFAYPNLAVIRVWEHIDNNIFVFRPLEQKQRQIAYIPKSELMLRTIRRTFLARAQAGFNDGIDVPWIAIENMTEQETAETLQQSIAFVFASVEEGLARMPLEAMLSGCVVFAHSNGPIPEYLPQDLCFEYGDSVAIVRELEDLLRASGPLSRQRFTALCGQSLQNALRFNSDQQSKSVCAAWQEIFTLVERKTDAPIIRQNFHIRSAPGEPCKCPNPPKASTTRMGANTSAMDLLHLATAGSTHSRPTPRTIVVFAHPDDEVIALGGRLTRHCQSLFVHVTDGAPQNGSDYRDHGFASIEAYRNARADELKVALTSVGIPLNNLRPLNIPDQRASFHLREIITTLVELIHELHPEVLITHPYEGGHPDHDACSLAVHFAVQAATQSAHEGPVIVEAPFYHAGPHGMETACFLPCRETTPSVVYPLTPEELQCREVLLDRFVSQQQMLRYFRTNSEQYRIAPQYNFSLPPHRGMLLYERCSWGLNGAQFRELARGVKSSKGPGCD